MPTCTNCTNWCAGHTLPDNEHILTQSPSCTNTDPSHIPAIPCTCKRDPITHEWIHTKGCPKHPTPP